jgi:hypothetical protein
VDTSLARRKQERSRRAGWLKRRKRTARLHAVPATRQDIQRLRNVSALGRKQLSSLQHVPPSEDRRNSRIATNSCERCQQKGNSRRSQRGAYHPRAKDTRKRIGDGIDTSKRNGRNLSERFVGTQWRRRTYSPARVIFSLASVGIVWYQALAKARRRRARHTICFFKYSRVRGTENTASR